jgi:Tol biopolymer transport system component
MSDDVRLERLLADVLADAAPTRAPSQLVPDILVAASRARRRPRWLALATERPMRRDTEVLVGSPMMRLAWMVVLALLLAALAVATLVAGGIIPRPTALVVTLPQPTPSASPFERQARNGMIAVAKAEAILLIDPTTGETVRTLEIPSTSGAEVTWSPDGQKLALAVPGGVWVMELSDATPRKILNCGIEAQACSIAWSPDGLVIAVAHGGQLELIDPDGSNRTTVHVQEGLRQPTWSPDGARIAFHGWVRGSDGDNGQGLYVINRDGSDHTLLLGPVAGIGTFDPAWSPDGSRIAYIGSTDRRTCAGASKTVGCTDDWRLHLMVLALDGSEPRELHPAGSCFCLMFGPSLTWSPDGRSIAMDGPGGDGVSSGLVVMDANGTGVRQLLEDAGMPAWQPLP